MLWILEHVEQLDPAEVLRLLSHVSEPRRARVLSMKNEAAQVRSILAELLLRHALREEQGLTDLPRIETGEKGKPFFPDRPDLQFNLSHCKTAVACALDAAPLGVDVQEVRPLRRSGKGMALPSSFRVLSASELAWVTEESAPEEQDCRFTAVWTCKEAYGKANGEGFVYDLRSTDFLPRAGSWPQYGFTFTHADLSGTLLTLCSAGPSSLKRVSFSELHPNPASRNGGKTMKHFLVVVDMQKDFVNGSLGTAEAVNIRPAVIEKIRSFDGEIIATLDTHGPEYLETAEGRKLPVEHCVKGTPGWQLDARIRSALKARGYTAVEKPTFGSLILPQLIRDRAGEEDFDVELIGLCTDICVISNALLLKASFPEKEISVDPACCAGVTVEKHQAALEVMKSCQISMKQGQA